MQLINECNADELTQNNVPFVSSTIEQPLLRPCLNRRELKQCLKTIVNKRKLI